LELFVDGNDVQIGRLKQHVSAAFVDAILETWLAEKDGANLRSKLCLFPCYGKYIVTDQGCKNNAINQVMWLWGESFILGGLVKRVPRRGVIDHRSWDRLRCARDFSERSLRAPSAPISIRGRSSSGGSTRH